MGLFDIISVQTFWRFLLFIHFVLAVALLGAVTLQAVALLMPARQTAGGFVDRIRSVPSASLVPVIVILYVPTFLLGAWVYIKYRTYVRIPMEQLGHWWTLGSFEFKEHIVSMGMGLLPAYWYFWRQPPSAGHGNERKWLTLFLAVTVWYAFLAGHTANDFRGVRIMTQTLDVNERISDLGRSRGIGAPMSTTTTTAPATTASKFGTFAITFGIAFAIIYTVLERLNWPLFTYHPAVGKLDFWMQRPRSGEGPPMYWYGWLALSFPAAAVLGWIATLLSPQALHRATIFGCALAALWSGLYAVGVYVADQASFDADFLKSVWVSAVPAMAGAAAVSYFVPLQWAQRLWTSWLLIMPIGGLLILGYSLKQYFLR